MSGSAPEAISLGPPYLYRRQTTSRACLEVCPRGTNLSHLPQPLTEGSTPKAIGKTRKEALGRRNCPINILCFP